jgi:hypothetical protein
VLRRPQAIGHSMTWAVLLWGQAGSSTKQPAAGTVLGGRVPLLLPSSAGDLTWVLNTSRAAWRVVRSMPWG